MKDLFKILKAKTPLFRHRAQMPNLTDETGAKEQTGGLKIMTVVLFVLAAHVVVIGGYTAYGLVKGSGKEAPTSLDETAPALADTDKPAPAADATAAASAPATTPPAPASLVKNEGTPAIDTGGNGGSNEAINLEAAPAAPAPSAAAVAPAPVVDNTPKTAAAPAAHTSASAAPAGRVAYAVKGGDTLNRIAKSHGMTVASLKQMNGLKGDSIRVGQKLTVLGSAAAPSAIAPAPAKAAPAQAVAAATYTVAKGDTLTRIAKRYNTSPAALMAANRLSDPHKLKIGDVLRIPVPADRREVSSQKVAPAAVSNPHATNPDLVMNK